MSYNHREWPTIREIIAAHMREYHEDWSDVEAHTLTEKEMDSIHAESFTVWTPDRVYFPTIGDMSHGCTSVPRHPNGEATGGVGDVHIL